MTSAAARRALAALAVAAGVVALFFLTDALARRHPRRVIPQAGANLAVVLHPSFATGISNYPPWWPPLYPVVLEGMQRLGVEPARANSVLYAALVVVVVAFVRREAGGGAAAAAGVLLALLFPASYNVVQITAETLFALEAFVVLLLLAPGPAGPSTARILLAALICGAATLTRFFGVVWPAVALPAVIAAAPRPWRWRLTRLAAAGAIVLVVLVPWLAHLHETTGHWFGSDRKEPWQAGKIASWNELRDPGTNAAFTLKTLAVDFFSPVRVARHEVVNKLPLTSGEWLATGVGGVLLLAYVVRRARRPRTRRGLGERLRDPEALTLFFGASFFVATFAVWSTSNNDPLYSRFLFPAYPFLVASGALAGGRGPTLADRLPLAALGLLVLGASLARWAAT
jgi:hypothetical protein